MKTFETPDMKRIAFNATDIIAASKENAPEIVADLTWIEKDIKER